MCLCCCVPRWGWWYGGEWLLLLLPLLPPLPPLHASRDIGSSLQHWFTINILYSWLHTVWALYHLMVHQWPEIWSFRQLVLGFLAKFIFATFSWNKNMSRAKILHSSTLKLTKLLEGLSRDRIFGVSDPLKIPCFYKLDFSSSHKNVLAMFQYFKVTWGCFANSMNCCFVTTKFYVNFAKMPIFPKGRPTFCLHDIFEIKCFQKPPFVIFSLYFET